MYQGKLDYIYHLRNNFYRILAEVVDLQEHRKHLTLEVELCSLKYNDSSRYLLKEILEVQTLNYFNADNLLLLKTYPCMLVQENVKVYVGTLHIDKTYLESTKKIH